MITKDNMSKYIYGSYIVYYSSGQIMMGHIVYAFDDIPSVKTIKNKIIELKNTTDNPIHDVAILNLQFLNEEAYNVLIG